MYTEDHAPRIIMFVLGVVIHKLWSLKMALFIVGKHWEGVDTKKYRKYAINSGIRETQTNTNNNIYVCVCICMCNVYVCCMYNVCVYGWCI